MEKAQVGDRDTVLLSAMWRYRWLILGIVVIVGAASLAFGLTRPAIYTASSSLVIEDPRSSTLFESVSVSPTRYLADQVAILQTGAVASRAAELAASDGFGQLDAPTFLEDARVAATEQSNFIQISFQAADAESAIFGANALADAYREVGRLQSIQRAASALEQLDDKIFAINTDLLSIRTRIDELRSVGPIGPDLSAQYQVALDRLTALYAIADSRSLTDGERQELADLSDRLVVIQRIASLQTDSSELVALQQELATAINQRSGLQTRRDQIEIDAELVSQSVALYSPAQEASETGSSLRLSLTVGLILGTLAGATIAYLLATRRQVFTGRLEPEAVLNAPLLAEIPHFRDEGIHTDLPVRDAPSSASAEAFRFAVTGIEIQASTRTERYSPPRQKVVRSLAVVSGRVGDGKTTVAGNLALAAARRGSSVLVIDADFGDQKLAKLLSSNPTQLSGITDIVEKGHELNSVVETVELAPGVQIDLLGRGSVRISAPDFFRSASTRAFFEAMREEYDLVLVDTPPILQVAYASFVTRYVDKTLVVVAHGSKQQLLADVRDRLALVGVPVAGYLYNRAPLRRQFTGGEGSMKDVLGAG